MFCTKCGSAIPEDVAVCPQCGTSAVRSASQDLANFQSDLSISPKPPQDSSNFQSFLNFDYMITPTIMKIIYIVGSVVIAIGALVGLFSGYTFAAVISIFGGAFALVIFRVLCEINMLFFKMHADIKKIQSNTADND